MELYELSVQETHELLASRKISAEELTRAYLERIQRLDPKIKSYVTVTKERAIEQAREADKRIKSGEGVAPLTGIPYAAKDSLSTRGIPTTCSSKILENYKPFYDCTAIKKLKSTNAVLLGKNNMDEFGMGSSTENSGFFTTRNPWNFDHVPGGSSGGSAAAVAAGLAPFTLGEDTGGSVRMPASFCGVTGLKTTYGRVSRYGLLPLVSSFDTIGPMARSAYDIALVLEAIAGHDPKDGTSRVEAIQPYSEILRKTENLRGLRIGIPKEYFVEGLDVEINASIRTAIRQLEGLGAEVMEVSLPHTQYAIPVYYLILFAEASSNLAKYDGIRFGLSKRDVEGLLDVYLKTREVGFGAETKRRIMLGTFALSAGYYDAYYLKAQKVRTLIRQDFEKAFEVCDALITPVAPTTAFRIGEKVSNPLDMYLSDVFSVEVNMAGIPAMSVPCGLSNGLPIGMQIIGPHLSEEMLLRIGYMYQSQTDWHTQHPPCWND
ncbi:MAG TPA: Asp-tRNA(Asn)/Glu-tRNA(Gln) amidotransferase subunit GatA [Anaerolineales bacterium]|nr:Asp-tRNA(Asn)/Glu-tRNA(Gln) amidotransferase subunit GatA [Anaerolineales bacterium]